MRRYKFSSTEKRIIERSVVPLVIYQYINEKITPVIISDGYCACMGLNREDAKIFLTNAFSTYGNPDTMMQFERMVKDPENNEKEHMAVFTLELPESSEKVYVVARGFTVIKKNKSYLTVYYSKIGEKFVPSEKIDVSGESHFNFDNTYDYWNYYDILTRLPNMTYFLKLSEKHRSEVVKNNDISVTICFNLNRMKTFNNRYGVDEGTHLLTVFADILRKCFGNEGSARFGEDSFYAFTEISKDPEVQVLTVFNEMEIANNGRSLPVRAGMFIDREGDTESSIACDWAKIACDSDRDNYESHLSYFDEKMLEKVNDQEYVLHHINTALKERWIQVYYHPIVRLLTGEICEEEALTRWIDPTLGVIQPGRFLPILEDAKLLYKVDLYMADRILEDLKVKKDAGLRIVPVSLNVSRYDFECCDMVSEIVIRTREAGIDPKYLNIEITETVMGMDENFLKEQIRLLHEEGFQVWMDDFGSGYSSLNILQEFDFDLVKLEMRFLTGVGKNFRSPLIVQNIVNMALSLGTDVIAEGVETYEQMEFLREIGCDKAQGYYYAKPMTLDRIIDTQGERRRENIDEARYYRVISMTSMYDPVINGDFHTAATDFGTGNAVGIIEYRDDRYYILRSNDSFRRLLREKFGVITGDIYTEFSDIREKFGGRFQDSVKRCIRSGNWERVGYTEVNDILVTFSVREITKNPVTGASALLVVVSMVYRDEEIISKYSDDLDKDGNEIKQTLSLYGQLPVNYIVVRVLEDPVTHGPLDMKYVFANKRYCNLVGKRFEELRDHSYVELFGVDDLEWPAAAYRAAFYGEEKEGVHFSHILGKWVYYLSRPISIPGCCAFVFLDIDKEQKEKEQLIVNSRTDDTIIQIIKLLNSEMPYEEILNKVLQELSFVIHPDRICILEIEGKTVINDFEWCAKGVSSTKNYLYTIADYDLVALWKKYKNDDGTLIIDDVDEVKKLEPDFYKFYHDNGIRRFMGVPLYTKERVIGFLCTSNYEINEIFDTKKLLETVAFFITFKITNNSLMNKLDQMCYIDALTEVYNRHGIDHETSKYLLAHPDAPCTIAALDIDDFKLVNDRYGHLIGDEVLKHLASSLIERFGELAIIGRNGGDEFLIIMKNMDAKESEPLFMSFTEEKHILHHEGVEYEYYISLGYAEYPVQADKFKTLFRCADAALYSVKFNGKHGCRQYTKDMHFQDRTSPGFGLREIAANMPGAILAYRADSEEKILYANQELLDIFDCRNMEDFIEYSDRSFRNVVHPDDLQRAENEIREQVDTGSLKSKEYIEFRIISKNGNVKHVKNRGRLIHNEYYGKVYLVLLLEE